MQSQLVTMACLRLRSAQLELVLLHEGAAVTVVAGALFSDSFAGLTVPFEVHVHRLEAETFVSPRPNM